MPARRRAPTVKAGIIRPPMSETMVSTIINAIYRGIVLPVLRNHISQANRTSRGDHKLDSLFGHWF